MPRKFDPTSYCEELCNITFVMLCIKNYTNFEVQIHGEYMQNRQNTDT